MLFINTLQEAYLRHGLTGHDDDDKRVFHFFFAT